MWSIRISRANVSRTDAAFRLLRYSLLTLICFMLVCTILAIILVSFALDYTPSLHVRTQGILWILCLIALIYIVGLVGVLKTRLVMVGLFSLCVLSLAGVCVLSPHPGHHLSNLGAMIIFATSGVLSILLLVQSCNRKQARHRMSVRNASVNCYHQVPDDWYDYGGFSDKDEQFLLPAGVCHCTFQDLLNPVSTFCTVETNERQFLNGDRYSV